MNDTQKAWIARIQFDPKQATEDLLIYNQKSPQQVKELLKVLQTALPDFTAKLMKYIPEENRKSTVEKAA